MVTYHNEACPLKLVFPIVGSPKFLGSSWMKSNLGQYQNRDKKQSNGSQISLKKESHTSIHVPHTPKKSSTRIDTRTYECAWGGRTRALMLPHGVGGLDYPRSRAWVRIWRREGSLFFSQHDTWWTVIRCWTRSAFRVECGYRVFNSGSGPLSFRSNLFGDTRPLA